MAKAKKSSEAKKTESPEIYVLKPGCSLVDPVTRQVITAEAGFRITADHPAFELNKHKFLPISVARERDWPILTEEETPEITKDEPPAEPEDRVPGL